jgi:hypothetical protein
MSVQSRVYVNVELLMIGLNYMWYIYMIIVTTSPVKDFNCEVPYFRRLMKHF